MTFYFEIIVGSYAVVPGGGHGNLLQCSCLENPHAQRSSAGSTVHGVAKSWTWLSNWVYALARKNTESLGILYPVLSVVIQNCDTVSQSGYQHWYNKEIEYFYHHNKLSCDPFIATLTSILHPRLLNPWELSPNLLSVNFCLKYFGSSAIKCIYVCNCYQTFYQYIIFLCLL